jgi:protein-tyrosine phosphatase
VIDLHNHVLPGVDDGAANLAEALRMLEQAAAQGITHVACTPHANDRMNTETDRHYQSVFEQLQAEVDKHGLPIELCLAAEIMAGTYLLKLLDHPFCTYHSSKKYFLLEFPLETPFEIILNIVKATKRKEFTPVIAHFERFQRAQREIEQPQAIKQAGAVLTLDAGSLVGQFGSAHFKRAKQLLKWNVVDILASDAHNDREHGFCMKAGFHAAVSIIGEAAAQKLVVENPRRVWDGLPWEANQLDTA